MKSTILENPADLIIIEKGLKRKIHQQIKEIKLLIRASANGDDSSKFH